MINRHILFHLTPFAKGCADLPATAKARNRRMFSQRPDQALSRLCQRLGAEPQTLSFLQAVDGLEVTGPTEPPTKPDRAVLAIIFDGISFDEARAWQAAQLSAPAAKPTRLLEPAA